MSTYAIGDLQGCYDACKALLEKINYQPETDQLWFTGDLINRGPDSLKTLRFVKSLPNAVTVLGNHDLSLLAIAEGFAKPHPKDTLDEILAAPDESELLEWLRFCPLLHHDKKLGFTLTHAGIYPLWSLTQAKAYAREVEALLQSSAYMDFLENMYGNQPNNWDEALTGWERARFITNAFTRMRYVTKECHLDLQCKGSPVDAPAHLIPWFQFNGAVSDPLVFGHWASLQGVSHKENIYPLDTGCVWGNALTALCLDSLEVFRIPCASQSPQTNHQE